MRLIVPHLNHELIAFDVITQQYDAQIGVIISVCRFVLIDVINGRLNIICCCRSIGKICSNADLSTLTRDYPVELAYALALIWADDAFSITPPWLLKTFPRIENVFNILRNTPCNGQREYCSSALDIHRALKRIFNYDSFRLYAGAPLQERAVQAAVDGKSLLAVFPTGGGKSLTFQLPALMSASAVKGLTVVISPLQSLMKDQVDNLNIQGITSAVTVNGLLDPIERANSLERILQSFTTLCYCYKLL